MTRIVNHIRHHLIAYIALFVALGGTTGTVAYWPRAGWSIDVRQPTLSVVSFSTVVDPLVCRLVRERVTVPAKWVAVQRHHQIVRVRLPAHTKVVNVERCRPRMV